MVVTGAERDFESGLLDQIDAAYSFARWTVGHPAEAERVTSEVVLQALRNPPSRRNSLRGWLLNEIRVAAVGRQRDSPQVAAGNNQKQTFFDLLVPPGMNSSIAARAAGIDLQPAEVELLRRATAELPLEKREVIVLRDTQELSYREIATILGIPRGTMMSRLWRARDALGVSLRGPRNNPVIHDGAPALIDSYIDSEIDIATAAAFVEHVAHCHDCAKQLLERSRLVQQIHNVTVCRAPERLRKVIKVHWRVETQRNRPV
jgi:RNA polymerase sigma-70 factor, ECF subfamily